MGIDGERARAVLTEIDQLEARLAEARMLAQSISESSDRDLAGTLYRSRRLRDAHFGEHAKLFGEPAWDMLLDLYSAYTTGREIPVTSVCIASCVPGTTALRHLGHLEARGLVDRRYDPTDGRRSLIAMSESGATLMRDWLARTGSAE